MAEQKLALITGAGGGMGQATVKRLAEDGFRIAGTDINQAGLDSRALGANRLATVGPVTAEHLAAHGLQPDAQPAKFVGAEIASALTATGDLAGPRILCPRSDIAPPDLVDALTACGATVSDVASYCTKPVTTGAEQVLDLLADDEVSWVTFTSSSTVTNFLAVIDADKVRAASVRLASIGPVTTETLVAAGFTPDTEAQVHTIDGLVDAILKCEAADQSAAEPPR